MGLGKTYSTKYLLDSNNNSGAAGQVLSTTSTGIDWADVNTLPGSGLWLENGNDIYNSNSGNVGINITGPGALLQIGTRGTTSPVSIPTTNGILFDFYNEGNPYTRHASIISQASDLTEAVIDFYTKPLQTTYAAATKKVTIRGNGNVGIGTAEPSAKLEVLGQDIEFYSGTGSQSLQLGRNASERLEMYVNDNMGKITAIQDADGNSAHDFILNRMFGGTGANNFMIQKDGSTQLLVDTNGNVGIGTTSPGYKLQVGDNGVADGNIAMKANGTGVDAGAELTFNMNVGGGNADSYIAQIVPISYDSLSSGTHSSLNFKVGTWNNNADAGASRMTILSNGNVGIGTTDPGAKLNVAGDILINSGEYISWGTVGATSIEGSTASNKLQFRTNSSDRMIINSAGNVGIGTTGPNNLLELFKTVDSDIGPILQLTNSQYGNANNSGSSIQFRGYTAWGPGSTNPRYSEINAINGSGSVPKRIEFKFYADTNVKTPLSILQTGRVGVGTTTPGNVFVVESAASASAAEFINTNADANPSGIILKKLSTSPADEDVLGRIIFQGNNDNATPALRTFARIETKATNVTDGNEDGELSFWTSKNAAQSKRLLISPEGAVQSKTSGNIILNYRSGSPYSYTSGTLYNNWNKIGTFTAPGNSSRIFTEILAKGDNNYPYWMKGTVMVSFYSTGISVSCQTDGGYNGGHNFQCIVTKDGTTYDVWVRVPTIEWSCFVQYRTLNNSGFTENYVFTIASGNVSNSAPTGQDDETPAIEPNSSYRFNISDLQTPNQTYNSNKFLVNGDTNVVFSPDQNYFTQKVGIGETLPQEMLDVGGNIVMDASNARLKIKSGVTGTSGGVDWTFNTASTKYARIDLDYDTRASTGLLIDSGYPMTLDYSSGSFSVKKNGSSELTILNGEVGIGTASPDGKLHVEDTTLYTSTPPPILTLEQQYPEIIIKDIGTYVSIDTYYRNSSDITVANYSINSNPGYIGIRTTFDSGGTGGTLFVQGQNEFSWSINNTSEVMRVHTNGNVGIGITAPGQKLDVDGTIRGTAFKVGNSTSTYLSVTSYSNQPYINTGTTGGTVNFGAPATNTTNVYVQGTITANADVVAYSDERLKSNIKTLDGSKVYEMRGVSFDKDGKKSSGVIAQEMEKVAPELVKDGEYKAVAYGNISGYLIEAIKELKAEIDLLKSKPCTCNKCNCNI
jgi:hypothetical protein